MAGGQFFPPGFFPGDAAGYPDPADVREGVLYGPNNEYIGTLVVPALGGSGSAINTLAAFRDLLLSISSLTAIVGSRVNYRLPESGQGKAYFPCVLVTRSPGGSLDEYVPERDVRFDVRCYGISQPQADQVNRAVQSVDGMNSVNVGNYHFDRIKEIQSWDQPEQVTDAEVWDCVFSMWEATLHYES